MMWHSFGTPRGAASVGAAALLLVVGACVPPAAVVPPPPAASSPATLRPGDVVRIAVWREPELSGDFTVDESGVLVLPMLGSVPAAAVPESALRARIAADYGAHLVHPAVNVLVLHQVRVLGAVRNPGLYAIEPTLTMGDVIARAGGLTPAGDITHVDLVRGGQMTRLRSAGGTLLDDHVVRSGDQLVVAEHRWILRNPGVIAATITATAAALIAFSRR